MCPCDGAVYRRTIDVTLDESLSLSRRATRRLVSSQNGWLQSKSVKHKDLYTITKNWATLTHNTLGVDGSMPPSPSTSAYM